MIAAGPKAEWMAGRRLGKYAEFNLEVTVSEVKLSKQPDIQIMPDADADARLLRRLGTSIRYGIVCCRL